MSEAEDNLEELVRRPARREPAAPRHAPAGFEARCDCGARITAADLYGERGGTAAERWSIDLGRPRLRPGERFLLYRCPLCGHLGELKEESSEW